MRISKVFARWCGVNIQVVDVLGRKVKESITVASVKSNEGKQNYETAWYNPESPDKSERLE